MSAVCWSLPRFLRPAPPLLRAAVGLPCLPRSLLGVGGRSRRGRVARETRECVCVCVCVVELERERESARKRGSPKLETKEHTHTHALGFYRLLITLDELLAAAESPERRHRDAESCAAFFFGGGSFYAAPWGIRWPEQDCGFPHRNTAFPEWGRGSMKN